MKLIIDIEDEDYAMLKNTSITLDWNTIWHGKEKDKELTFAIFNLTKALVDGKPYEERPQGEWIFRQGVTCGGYYKCNKCGEVERAEKNFCSNCGAEMRGKEE